MARVGKKLTYLAVAAVLCLYYFLYVDQRTAYPAKRMIRRTSLFRAKRGPGKIMDTPYQVGCAEPDVTLPRANAAFIILTRNQEFDGVSYSISSLERHFNRWFHYPYILLNDEPFSEEFKEKIKAFTSSPVEFGVIDPEIWEFPEDVEKEWVSEAMDAQGDMSLPYGPLKSYHQMCRFFSGNFHKHKLMQKYDWYWRVEPDVEFFCDITYDVFRKLEDDNKKYAFNVLAREFAETIPNLFRYTNQFKKDNNLPDTDLWNALVDCGEDRPLNDDYTNYVARMDGCHYNGCHFWTNFEIARVDLWNDPIYQSYFKYLEEKAGFWRERWGDAPVHTLGLSLFLNSSDIHYFRDIGYSHSHNGHDPGNAPGKQLPLPPYNENDGDWSPDPTVKNGVGCRCKRPRVLDFEDTVSFERTWELFTDDP